MRIDEMPVLVNAKIDRRRLLKDFERLCRKGTLSKSKLELIHNFYLINIIILITTTYI